MTTAPGTIDDLTRHFPETTAGTQWQMLSDAVMGGVSAGRMSRTVLAGRPAIRMEGDVSLENNGGFIQIAVDLAPNGATFNAAGFSGIAIDVLGNDEDYGLHLRTSELSRPWQSYRSSFIAKPVWQEIKFPFSSFAPHRTEIPLNVHLLRRLGIVAIGRIFSADVAIGGIRLY
ncbi:MAG: CIA30 family protein [Aestuariivirga sp.]|uniref:CIA30 family protein n=1 Tax=Aestuariivirga sp. TaxID=2650926 RepID=UPI0025B9A5D2|nr:CIA30 family protein [Aestuariivirga sp.]MCA3560589.1 CIA30 family protein [Aestuariivirga sp.]